MKRMHRKYKKQIIITSLILFLFVPLCIHVLFKIHPQNSFFSAEWTAGDVLLFYGSVLAAVGTAFGVFLTVRYSQKNYQEDVKKRVLPYITITQLVSKYRYNLGAALSEYLQMADSPEGSEGETQEQKYEKLPIYEEHQLEKVYFVFKSGKFEAMDNLPKEYEELLTHRGIEWKVNERGAKVFSPKGYLSFPLLLENVGCGPAINLRIGLNKTGEHELFIRPRQLIVQQSMYIHIFVPEFEICDEMSFNLTVVYQDIYKNKYRQDYAMTLTNEKMSLAFEAEQIQMEDLENG